MQLAQLAIGVLGVLVITAEYSTGIIRAFDDCRSEAPTGSLAEGGRLWCSSILSLMIPADADRILHRASRFLLAPPHRYRLSHIRGVARAVDRGGALPHRCRVVRSRTRCDCSQHRGWHRLRSPGIMFVLPPLMNVFPSSWNHAASPYLPLAAGESIMSITPGTTFRPGSGLRCSPASAAAALGVVALLLLRRDT